MDASSWAAMSAIASAASAVIALFVAQKNFQQTKISSQSADFATCLSAISALADAQRRVIAAADEDARKSERHELLNLMEVFGQLHNENSLTPSARKIIEEYLDETLAWLRAMPATNNLLADAVTGPDTFKELDKFSKRLGSRCQALTERYRRQISESATSAESSTS